MHIVAHLPPVQREFARSAEDGSVLFWEGDPCDHVYELRRGVARGVSISGDGERQIVAFFFAGDQIGLPITDHYRFTAEAVTDLVYIRHSRSRWHEAFVRSCRDEGRLLPSISSEQDPMFRRGIIVGRIGVQVRLCAFLVSIADRLPVGEGGALLLPITQIDIAAYLATTHESVCRAFRRLREMGIVAMPERDRIEIIDPDRLMAIASGTARHI